MCSLNVLFAQNEVVSLRLCQFHDTVSRLIQNIWVRNSEKDYFPFIYEKYHPPEFEKKKIFLKIS